MAKAKRYTDRDYMIEAIEEMRLSRDDHEDKPDPMVGAVLVMKGEEGKKPHAKAHRGMLRVGDHAEFTLLERLLPSEDVEGATIYVTLEPCTERSIPKKPCCERVANARIAKVFIGITDPNPDIEGKGIEYLKSKGIEVKFFDTDLAKQISEINNEFIKHWEEEKKKPKPIEMPLPSEFEVLSVRGTDENSFDQKIIKDFLENAGELYKTPSPELWKYFERKRYLHLNDDEKTDTATNAGILLFGKNVTEYFPHGTIMVEINKTGNAKARISKEIKGSILTQPQQVIDLLLDKMEYYTEIPGLKREESVPEYPMKALREVIVNAIVHRDYNDKQGNIYISLLEDSLIVKSPGLPISPIVIEDFHEFNVPSYRRNPHIGEAFKTMKMMDERGWGLNNMRQWLGDEKLPPPIFSKEGNYVVVTFLGRKFKGTGIIEPANRDVYLFIKEKGSMKREDIDKQFKINERTSQRILKELLKEKLIVKEGSGPNIKYRAR